MSGKGSRVWPVVFAVVFAASSDSSGLPRQQPPEPKFVDLRVGVKVNEKVIGKKLFEVLRSYKPRTFAAIRNDSGVKNEVLLKKVRALWASDAKLEAEPRWIRFEGCDYFDCVVICAKGTTIRLTLGATKGGSEYGYLVTPGGSNYFALPPGR